MITCPRLDSPFRSGVAGLTLFVILASLLPSLPVQAQGGIALSGSFYRQPFEIPQGASVSAPSVYVIVFNNSHEATSIRMTPGTPMGVNLSFSEEEFTLEAGGQKKVLIQVEVAQDAIPGEYKIGVTAEPYSEEKGGGIKIKGAASQNAHLTVTGQAARVTVHMVNPDGGPVRGDVRLFKEASGEGYEVAFSSTGILETAVAPGSYTAVAYMATKKLGEERFEVAAGEEKKVLLTVKTVYFEGFGVVANYHTKTGELAFAQVVYTLVNLYEPVEVAEVILQVSQGDTPIDELLLATLAPLELGRMGLNYNYVPAEGWEIGTYDFRLQLLIAGKPYATTQVERLYVEGAEETPVQKAPARGYLLPVVSVLIVMLLIVMGIVLFTLVRRRKKKTR